MLLRCFSHFPPGRRLLLSWWTLSKFTAHVHMFVCSLCLLTGGLWALILNLFFHLCDGRMGNRYGATDVIDKKEDNKLHRNPIQSADFSALERGRIISKTGPLNKWAASNAIFCSLRSSEFRPAWHWWNISLHTSLYTETQNLLSAAVSLWLKQPLLEYLDSRL